MIYAVFLCDKNWMIKKIKQNDDRLSLCEGEFLTDMASQWEKLEENEEKYYSLELTFLEHDLTVPGIIRSYKEGNLVILASANNNQELFYLIQ